METRRTILKYLTGAVGASVCGLETLESFARPAFTASKRPNIVCVVGEGLRWDELSSTGNKLIRRRIWTASASEGCTFRNAFVVNALCLPSRATMLTGMYSHTTGAFRTWRARFRRGSRWCRICLQKAGYETAFLGKSHVEGALMDHYWDYYFGFVGQADYYRPKITEGFAASTVQEKLYEGGYVDTLLTRQGCRVAEADANQTVLPVPLVLRAACAVLPAKDLVNDLNGVAIPKPATFR